MVMKKILMTLIIRILIQTFIWADQNHHQDIWIQLRKKRKSIKVKNKLRGKNYFLSTDLIFYLAILTSSQKMITIKTCQSIHGIFKVLIFTQLICLSWLKLFITKLIIHLKWPKRHMEIQHRILILLISDNQWQYICRIFMESEMISLTMEALIKYCWYLTKYT